jgi:hypothetical protein
MIAGRRYIICRNEEEARKDAEARSELVAGLERKLAHGDKALVDQFLAQHQGKEGAEDVAAEAGVGLVKDRPGGEQRLCGF